MKIVGVIPARYCSSRFPGKPLADICGKPMIWWVYNAVIKVESLKEVYIATDDERIKNVCDRYNMKCIMTQDTHDTHIDRISEFAEKVDADLYVCVCGDEPLIDPDVINEVIPNQINEEEEVNILVRKLSDPVETIEPGNIKILFNNLFECISLSRSPIPFPYKTLDFSYYKIIGVECYNKKALEFFSHTEKGRLESIEEVTLMRYIENRKLIKVHLVDSYELSVDTKKDLERIINIIKSKNVD